MMLQVVLYELLEDDALGAHSLLQQRHSYSTTSRSLVSGRMLQ